MTTRTFTDEQASRQSVPLLLGIAGCSGSGKTFSALRLAAGMQRVIGGEIFFIDTEHRRGLHYADYFKFRHVNFEPPFGPLDYLRAIEYCVGKGAKILVIDSMTHEHASEGGVMDRSEKFLEQRCGDDERARDKMFMLSLKAPKLERRKLNTAIVQMGINSIFCYRATDRVKPVQGQGIKHIGWQPETTSPLVYEMAQCFLLPPGSDGRPELNPAENAEKMLTKTPAQFREWFKPGFQLNEDLGQKMAEWARGPVGAAEPPPAATPEFVAPAGWENWSDEERGDNRAHAGTPEFRAWWKTLSAEAKLKLQTKTHEWGEVAKDADARKG